MTEQIDHLQLHRQQMAEILAAKMVEVEEESHNDETWSITRYNRRNRLTNHRIEVTAETTRAGKHITVITQHELQDRAGRIHGAYAQLRRNFVLFKDMTKDEFRAENSLAREGLFFTKHGVLLDEGNYTSSSRDVIEGYPLTHVEAYVQQGAIHLSGALYVPRVSHLIYTMANGDIHESVMQPRSQVGTVLPTEIMEQASDTNRVKAFLTEIDGFVVKIQHRLLDGQVALTTKVTPQDPFFIDGEIPVEVEAVVVVHTYQPAHDNAFVVKRRNESGDQAPWLDKAKSLPPRKGNFFRNTEEISMPLLAMGSRLGF